MHKYEGTLVGLSTMSLFQFLWGILQVSLLVPNNISSLWLFSVTQNSIHCLHYVQFKALLLSLSSLLVKTLLPHLIRWIPTAPNRPSFLKVDRISQNLEYDTSKATILNLALKNSYWINTFRNYFRDTCSDRETTFYNALLIKAELCWILFLTNFLIS